MYQTENVITQNFVKEGNRVCKHGGEVYTYGHHRQMYSTEKCRIEAWEKRNGKTFKKEIKGKKGGVKGVKILTFCGVSVF